jgi:hypothetical protein
MSETAGETLKERLRADLNTARRARDKLRTLLLTTTLAEVRNREIELGRDVADPDVIELIGRAIKRRREAAEQIRKGGRNDLADREDEEAGQLSVYLPPRLDEGEVRDLVRGAIAAGADTVGTVMAAVMPRIKGSFDGREANRIVREELGA